LVDSFSDSHARSVSLLDRICLAADGHLPKLRPADGIWLTAKHNLAAIFYHWWRLMPDMRL
jgi:hypothetical protein